MYAHIPLMLKTLEAKKERKGEEGARGKIVALVNVITIAYTGIVVKGEGKTIDNKYCVKTQREFYLWGFPHESN